MALAVKVGKVNQLSDEVQERKDIHLKPSLSFFGRPYGEYRIMAMVSYHLKSYDVNVSSPEVANFRGLAVQRI